jgi:hypothetical protein
MRYKKILICFLFFSFIELLPAQTRSFDEIFPNLNNNIKSSAFGKSGYIKTGKRVNGFEPVCKTLATGIEKQITDDIFRKNPGYLVESITVIPVNNNQIKLLNVYNALMNVSALKGRLYSSASRKQDVPLFEEATRIVSGKNTAAIPDPASASSIPQTETIFIKLKDINFGNTYYRGDLALTKFGLSYNLTNFKSFTYLLIPVIKEENFTAKLYFEIIQEGILIYSLAGADISDFIASKIDMDSAIAKRLSVIISWAAEGIVKR